MQSRWILAPREELNGGAIAWSEICGAECIARLLLRKGFRARDEVETFLRPRLKSLGDPFLLPQMDAAVARILTALDRQERIVLFGDYDVDGVTSLALLGETLGAYGAGPELFLPLRMEEGYGLSPESVARCVEQHRPQLLIAVDCGTSSVNEIVDLTQRGVDVIVLDHHEPKAELPKCAALVNPKIGDRAFEYLCSAGVVFKLCHALLKARRLTNFDLRSRLDLVALGTVADIVPLRDENRTFVQHGAIEIARSTRVGLRKLMQVAGVRPPILTEDIGFRLGPRLNAAGRLTTAEKSLRLLLTDDEAEAEELAQFLDTQNRERREVEDQIFAAAEEKIDKSKIDNEAAIVVAERGWHVGVLGIVASRLTRKFHRPTIVIGIENGIGKGSGRSIEGLNLVDALKRCASIAKIRRTRNGRWPNDSRRRCRSFRRRFRAAAAEMIAPEFLQPRLYLDHELSLGEIDVDLLRWHEMLQPFGNANPQPLFFAREVTPLAPPLVLKEKHLKLRIGQGKHHRRAMFFDGATMELPPPPWDIAFKISADDFGDGERLVAMHIAAVRASEPLA